MIQSPLVSPYRGRVVKIFHPLTYHYRTNEPLFLIQTKEGLMKEIIADGEGIIQSYEVNIEDEVFPGMVLAYTEEDLSAIGRIENQF